MKERTIFNQDEAIPEELLYECNTGARLNGTQPTRVRVGDRETRNFNS